MSFIVCLHFCPECVPHKFQRPIRHLGALVGCVLEQFPEGGWVHICQFFFNGPVEYRTDNALAFIGEFCARIGSFPRAGMFGCLGLDRTHKFAHPGSADLPEWLLPQYRQDVNPKEPFAFIIGALFDPGWGFLWRCHEAGGEGGECRSLFFLGLFLGYPLAGDQVCFSQRHPA